MTAIGNQHSAFGSIRAIRMLNADELNAVSHHFGAPQIMQVNDALKVAAVVHHGKRSDLALLHHVQRGDSKFVATNRLRRTGHALFSGERKYFSTAAFQQTPQVPVTDDAEQFVAVNDSRYTEPFARHFVD